VKVLNSFPKIIVLRVFLRQAEAIIFWNINNLAEAVEKFPTGRVRTIHRKKMQKQLHTDQKMLAPWQCLEKLVTKPKLHRKVTK